MTEAGAVRATRRFLSGWARAWVVATLAIWIAGVVFVVVSNPGAEERLPPALLSKEYLCNYYDGHVGGLERAIELERARRANEPLRGFYDLCLSEGRWVRARAWYAHSWRQMYWSAWPFWLAPFALGCLLMAVAQIRRGFSAR